MEAAKMWLRGGWAVVLVACLAAPLGATTLMRASLEELTATHHTVVVGQVLDAVSYWNREGTFILTDVRLEVIEALKGAGEGRELTVTLMGGSVAGTTTLIIGGAELIPGRAYVLFLNREDLPGARGALTVRDHCQGAFEIRMTETGLRAISQANELPLVPDAFGEAGAAGGPQGFLFDEMIQAVRAHAGRPRGAGQEVQR